MRDFIGMENIDDTTKEAILNFSYYLSTGNMDEAYKAVKLIQSANVWENMAHMCVKTRRLDVAEVCLGNMGSAKGTRALREAKNEEKEAQLAAVAIELGLYEEAEKLYTDCERYDLLNRYYQSRGDWKKALLTAQKSDRIHLRNTYYRYGKFLESIGDTSNAIKQYELSETHRQEVPRMLYEADNFEDLEAYIENMNDKALTEWWARYEESRSGFDKALSYYRKSESYFALVRVLTFQQKVEEAKKVVQETGDLAGAYQLARYYENAQNVTIVQFSFLSY
jgi:intraflagellar transport protein 140